LNKHNLFAIFYIIFLPFLISPTC